MADHKNRISFVLVNPRSPGNVGSAARAMKNFGFRSLCLVDPRLHKARDAEKGGSFFETESRKMAWNAADLLEKAKVFGSLEEAIGNCGLILGTAPSPPEMFTTISPEEGALMAATSKDKTAILFGTESSGLTQKELSKCNAVVKIPTHKDYADLNLSQSLVLIAYLIFKETLDTEKAETKAERGIPQFLSDALAEDYLSIGMDSGFLKHRDSKVALELAHLFRNIGLSKRSAGLLRSLARTIKARLNKADT
jgi:tRNA (cytidine32/uridine32-2'-O)-methyltransferase